MHLSISTSGRHTGYTKCCTARYQYAKWQNAWFLPNDTVASLRNTEVMNRAADWRHGVVIWMWSIQGWDKQAVCEQVGSFSLYSQNSVESAYTAVDFTKLPAL